MLFGLVPGRQDGKAFTFCWLVSLRLAMKQPSWDTRDLCLLRLQVLTQLTKPYFYIYTSIGIVHAFIGLVSEYLRRLLHSQRKGYGVLCSCPYLAWPVEYVHVFL